MSDWRGVCLTYHRYHGIQKTAVGYRLAAMTHSLKSFWVYWSLVAGTAVKLAFGLGLSSRRKVRDAFRALHVHRSYVRFVAAAQRAELVVLGAATHVWQVFATTRMRMEDLLGTNERRNAKRALRWWL
jgi:hypothetical protein